MQRDAEKLYNDAAKAELAKQYDAAFRLYVKATEAYLHLNRMPDQQEKDRTNWKIKAERSLARAEKIKAFIERPNNLAPGSTQFPTSEKRLTPVGIDHFSPREQLYILKRGDLVNGHVFPPWDEPIQPLSTSPYQDPDGEPNLSPEQSKVAAYWRRPFGSELSLARQPENRDESFSSSDGPKNQPYRRSILPQEILQHIVTDCSVCASISVCLEHGRRFGSTLAESAVHRYENSRHASKSASGRYDVRVLFNGAWRRIVIDDKLPYNPGDGSLMCMFVLPSKDGGDLRSPHQNLWPSLLEKAYMKLMGGYDFPGSNSSIDLHALAGWIPEHIETKGSTFEREKTWERISDGFSSGQCVVTLGTGPRTDIFWHDVKLLESHSYAVIDAYETEEGRILTVLDSWVLHKEDEQQPSRTLRIPWTDVLNVFSGIYLSWDPQNWESSLSFHGMWKRTGEDQHSIRLLRMKFTLNKTSGIDREILVLLTRHVVDSKRTSDYIALRTELEDDYLPHVANNLVDYVSHKGTYTNSTHVLVRVRIPESQQSGVLGIFPSYEGDSTEVGYTISIYSSGTTIAWDEQLPPPPFTTKVDGVFTSKNAGGNCSYPTFMLNPQYHLHIYPPTSTIQSRPSMNQTSEAFPGALSTFNGTRTKGKCNVTLSMQTSKDIPVNIVATWSQGERVVELPQKDLAMNSGAYSYGLARVTKDLSPGDYTLILSAFEPHHIGPFSLRLDCSSSFDLKPIPQEGAGMYSKIIKGSWDTETATGGPSFNAYEKNPIFEVEIPCSAQVKFRLQLIHISTPVQMNLTVYPAQSSTSPFSSQTLTRHITTSGPYSDALSGVATPLLNLGTGRYWLVPSTYNPGVEARFRIIMYTSARGAEIKPKKI